MAIKTKVGQVATGEYFFKRENEINLLWDRIESGCNILISAPRRVGKTSLMYYLKDNPREQYRLIYIVTESVNSENEYYKKLFNHIVDNLKGFEKYKSKAVNFVKSLALRIETVNADGVTLAESKLNYYDELVTLIQLLDLEKEKIIIMVDEFAQTVVNILADENINSAVHFLESNRTLRQMPEINNKLQFIYAGSIGLENIVGSINAVNTINDLNLFKVKPLTKDEANQLITKLIDGSGMALPEEVTDYILNKIEWLIPFYIQLVIEETYSIKTCLKQDTKIDKLIIDQAFSQIFEYRNYFEHWHTRLRSAYKKAEYSFAKDVLNTISERGTMTSNEIINSAHKYKVNDNYKDIVNALKYDGYINYDQNELIYRFNSPILKMWWYTNVAH